MAEKAPWENDGKRYTAALQDKTDKCCYKDFEEFDTFEPAKQACDAAAERNQRSAIVYDRKMPGIIHKKVIHSAQDEVKNPAPLPHRGKRKAAETPVEEPKPKPKKKIAQDDFF